MKPLIALSLAALLLCTSCSSGNSSENSSAMASSSIAENSASVETSSGNGLVSSGKAVISLLNDELQNEDYLNLFGHISSIDDYLPIASKLGESELTGVYKIEDIDKYAEAVLGSVEADMSGFTDEMKKFVEDRCVSSVMSILNSSAVSISVSSMLSAEKLSVCNDIKENSICFFTYDKTYPVVVQYLTGDDGALLCKASFLLDDELINCTQEKLEENVKLPSLFTDCSIIKLETE